jgi:hypothetical protein
MGLHISHYANWMFLVLRNADCKVDQSAVIPPQMCRVVKTEETQFHHIGLAYINSSMRARFTYFNNLKELVYVAATQEVSTA